MPTTLLTDLAETKLATAAGSGSQVRIAEIALGDGNGATYDPTHDQTALVRERSRRAIDSAFLSGGNTWVVRAEFPTDTPAFSVREIGFFDEDGDLIAIWAGQDVVPRQTGAIIYMVEHALNFSRVADGLVIVSAPTDDAAAMQDQLDDAQTLLGRPAGATHLGQFPGEIIPDNATVREALVALEDAVGAGGGSAAVSLAGPVLVYPGSSNVFTITDYSDFALYTVATDVGTVVRVEETITLDLPAGASGDMVTLTVMRNDVATEFGIALGGASIARPTILAPIDGNTGVGSSVAISASTFQTFPAALDTHQDTDWQIATDAAFASVVWESLADAANKTAIAVPSGTLQEADTYFLRVRFRGGALGTSQWSPVISIATAASFAPSAETAILPWSEPFGAVWGGVGVSGDVIAVGVPEALSPITFERGAGSVDIHARAGGGWTLAQTLQPAGLIGEQWDFAYQEGEHFGAKLAIDGDILVVGAPRKSAWAGAFWIYERQGDVFGEVATGSGSGSDQMGIAVAVSGQRVIVGAETDDPGAVNAGAAFIYEGPDWGLAATLVASDPQQNLKFGAAVAIDGDLAVVGAGASGNPAPATGAAYVFERDGAGVWTQIAKLTASDQASGDGFGRSVAIHGTTILVGAPQRDGAAGADTGAVYVFKQAGGVWNQSAVITSPTPGATDHFGAAVALSGAFALIGAPLEDAAGTNSGAAFLFEDQVSGWVAIDTFTASDGAINDRYGTAVDLDQATAVIAAPYAAAAYVIS